MITGIRNSRAALFFRTARFLKPVQVLAQIRNYLPRIRPGCGRLPGKFAVHSEWIDGIPKHVGYLGNRRFHFLNSISTIGHGKPWWQGERGYLWNYNLHYFEWLHQEDFPGDTQEALQLIENWCVDNRPGQARSWDPYPVSMRIINWVRFAAEKAPLPTPCIKVLAFHARWLTKRVEYHLLANHFLLNGIALMFAGSYFDGDEAMSWLKKGWKIVSSELDTQIHSDGGHFERSPMYHSLVLEDLLNLLNLAKSFQAKMPGNVEQYLTDRIPRMLSWLGTLQHLDGSLPLFNDSADGIASTYRQICDYAKRLGVKYEPAIQDERLCAVLIDSGFARLQRGSAVLFIEFGGPAPDYQPGHSHAGTNGFELAVADRKILVDTGTSTYDVSEERIIERSTRAHNTLEVAGENSSEVWSSFRVGGRAKGRVCDWGNPADGPCMLETAHDGYVQRGLAGEHVRRWQLTEQSCEITDEIEADGIGSICIYFHFHPSFQVSFETGAWRFRHNQNEFEGFLHCDQSMQYAVHAYAYHRQFGKSEQASCVVATAKSRARCFSHSITWCG